MCGRFSIAGFEGFEERFQIKIEFPDLKPNYNVAPSQDVPVILNNGLNYLAMFRWGLIPFWAKDPLIGHKMINARAETVDEKPSFKTCLQRKRCLIVADGFYEWKKEGSTKRSIWSHREIEFNRTRRVMPLKYMLDIYITI